MMTPPPIARIADLVRRHFAPLCVASILVGSIANVYFLLRFDQTYVTRWLLRQYYVNYVDFGFTKRGLIGTIFQPYLSTLGNNELGGQYLVIALEAAVFAGLIAMLIRLCRRSVGDGEGGGILTLVMAAFILSPVGFQQFAWDIGRYDHLNILLLLAAIWAILRARLVVASALFAAMVLVHEAAFFYGAGPIAVALFATRARFRDFVLCLAPAAAMLAAVGLWGNLTPAELALLATRPGADTSVWSRGVLTPPLDLKPHEIVLILYYTLLPFVVLYGIVRHNGGSLLRSFAPPLIALLLFPLGFDYFRWAGLGFISVATSLIVMARTAGWTLPRYPGWALALLLPYLIPLGPIGTAHPLYFVELLLSHL